MITKVYRSPGNVKQEEPVSRTVNTFPFVLYSYALLTESEYVTLELT